jgi:hypothetical protein
MGHGTGPVKQFLLRKTRWSSDEAKMEGGRVPEIVFSRR